MFRRPTSLSSRSTTGGALSGAPPSSPIAVGFSLQPRSRAAMHTPHGPCRAIMESVMKRPTNRLTKLLVAVAAAATAGPAIAQPTFIRGEVTLENGAVIPKGQLEIHLEDRTIQDQARRRSASTHITSDGGSKAITFSLSLPSNPPASPTLQIVARLERADGWLIARGSAPFKLGSPIQVTLNTVMY